MSARVAVAATMLLWLAGFVGLAMVPEDTGTALGLGVAWFFAGAIAVDVATGRHAR